LGETALRAPKMAVKTAVAKNPVLRPFASDRAPHVYEPNIMPMKTTLVMRLS
jgi:hypothetical protein